MQYLQLTEITTAISAGFLVLLVVRRLRWSERTEARKRRFIQRYGLLRHALMDSLLLVPASVAVALATHMQGFSPTWYVLAALLAIAAIVPPVVLAIHPRMDSVDLSPASIDAAVTRRRRSAPIYFGILLIWMLAWYIRA